MSPPRRRLLACALLAALAGLGCWNRSVPSTGPDLDGDVRLSLLAVGDTGKYLKRAWLPSVQGRVARAMEAAHRQRPVHALLLLGDNFYPNGLLESELAARIAMNVVRPYCRFADLSAPRSAEVEHACGVARDARQPIPILAVLGNHDDDSDFPESALLQKEAVRDFVANWEMPRDAIAVRELGQGVSLILLQSMDLVRNRKLLQALPQAIRSAAGPWRILVAHHPLLPTDTAEAHGPFEVDYMERAQEAIRAAGVPVQLSLAGHHHSLQILESIPPVPPLQVVSGAGSRAPRAPVELPGVRFAAQRNGFARVDLVEGEAEEHLVVSLYVTRSVWLPGGRPELVTRWSIALDGAARQESMP